MKTLFFVLVGILFCSVSYAQDGTPPFQRLPWHAVDPADIPETRSIATTTPDHSVFTDVLATKNVPFTVLLTRCGYPAAECPHADSGHLFRYDLPDGGHMYICVRGLGPVTLAVYQPK